MAASSRLARARAVYRGLVDRGLAPKEAANMAAWIIGLEPDAAGTGWTPTAIECLLFMAWSVRSGRLVGDTLADPETLPWAAVWS